MNIWEKIIFFISLIAKHNPHVFLIILLRMILEWWLNDAMHYKNNCYAISYLNCLFYWWVKSINEERYHKFLSSNSNSCCKYISAVIHNFYWCFFARTVLVEPGREKGSSKSTLLNDRVRSVWCNYCINNERQEAETCGCDDSTIVTQSLTSSTARLCGADDNQLHDLQGTLASDYAQLGSTRYHPLS